MSIEPPAWIRSSACANAACVEVAIDGAGVKVRDSKNRDSPALSYTIDEWSAFLVGVKAGEFDVSPAVRQLT